MDPTTAATQTLAQSISQGGLAFLLAGALGVAAWLGRALLAAKDRLAEKEREYRDHVETLYRDRRSDDERRLAADAQILKALDTLTDVVQRGPGRTP